MVLRLVAVSYSDRWPRTVFSQFAGIGHDGGMARTSQLTPKKQKAIVAARKLEDSALDVLREMTDRTVVSTREKLRLFGLTETQIQEVVERGVPDEHVVIQAPGEGIVVHKNALKGMYVEVSALIHGVEVLTGTTVPPASRTAL